MTERTYRVTEIFRSVQGEGPEAGMDAVFVRFTGCNLACDFCDEPNRTGGAQMTAAEIVAAINLEAADWAEPERIILTGGEPLLQVDLPLMHAIAKGAEGGDRISIETNGSAGVLVNPQVRQVCEAAELVVMSPKCGLRGLAQVLLDSAHHMGHRMQLCIKALVPLPGDLSIDDLADLSYLAGPDRCYLQPVTPEGWEDNPAALAELRDNAKLARDIQLDLAGLAENDHGCSRWRVLPQTHVWVAYR